MRETWPVFLNRLEEEPQRAFAEFFSFAQRLLEVCPPGVLTQIPPDNREDVIHDIILHCCQDDFRVLKRYADQGRPFAAWFQLVARNKILDHLRSSGKISMWVRTGTAAASLRNSCPSSRVLLATLQTTRSR